MKAFSLAIAFVRIPRFFFALLLGPLFIGLIIISCQVMMLYTYSYQVTRSADTIRSKTERDMAGSAVRYLLYGDRKRLGAIKTCRWLEDSSRPGNCAILDYDVVLRVEDPSSFDPTPYERFFSGITRQLHICRDCLSEIVINTRSDTKETHVRSIFAALVPLVAKDQNLEITERVASVWEKRDEITNLLGTSILHLPGANKPIVESVLSNDLVIVMNVVILVVVTLWLALRSHRKVLDYFASNGALLPLVAANGKKAFYSSIWLITLFRVLLFLGSSVPVTCIVLTNMIDGEGMKTSLNLTAAELALWLIGLVTSLALLTLLGSIAELKHRRPLYYIIFKYVPISVCLLGGIVWAISLAIPGTGISVVRSVIAVLPITGLFPLLLAPLFSFDQNIIATHIIIATLSVVFLMYKNARWFAAHLEEL